MICRRPFLPRTVRATRCPECQKRRPSNPGRREFIGIDGEGTGKGADHRYVLISCGAESLHNNGRPLLWWEILGFLYACFRKNPQGIYLGYFLGYDFTHTLKTLPEDRARMLITDEGVESRKRTTNPIPFPVYISGGGVDWEVDFMAGRRLSFRPSPKDPYMHVCDAGSFWQSSFMKAIDPAKWEEPICTVEEYDIIREGKANRSDAVFDLQMVKYNVTENAVMSKLADALDKGFQHAGIRLAPKQWIGPGQAAGEWLRMVDSITSEEVSFIVPPQLIWSARASYYGGWFEQWMHGLIPGETYGYDINSAYPHVISRLPCLRHAKFERTLDRSKWNSEWSFFHVTARFPKGGHGFVSHRDSVGHILRPLLTSGWITGAEFAVLNKYYPQCLTVHDAWIVTPTCDCPVYKSIRDLYLERIRVGKNTPAGMALKLLYNSVYGKLAQSVASPMWANPLYASWITGTTRATILSAILTHPTGLRDLVMVATDGVYFRTPHPGLTISETELGKWSREYKTNLLIFMPGIYWDDKARNNLKTGGLSFKSRGVSAQDMAEKVFEIDDAFSRFDGISWPEVTIPINFGMITARQALARNDWSLAGRTFSYDPENPTPETIKVLSSCPETKRVPYAEYDGEVWRTAAYPESDTVDSYPYSKPIGVSLELVTPDGLVNDDIQEILRSGDDGL